MNGSGKQTMRECMCLFY